MSNQIDTARVEMFKKNIMILSQQKGSRLAPTVRQDGDIVGKRVHFDLIGATASQKRVSRHSDTPLINTPHSRRSAVMADYDWADLVDNADKLKIINDPTSSYVQNAVFAFGRDKDDVIITALGGSAGSGEDGSTLVALPSAQKVAVGTTGLSVAKLRAAKLILDKAEVDPDTMRFIAVTAEQMDDLLGDTNVTSSDFNTVKALVSGEVDTYMGFKFVKTQRLVKTGNNRAVYAYLETAIGLGVPQDINARVTERDDKNYSTQVYANMSIGAVRVEDVQVVEITCKEA